MASRSLNHDQKAKVFTSIWMTHKPRMNFSKYVCVTYTVFRTINQQEERDMHVENEALYYLQWTDDTKFIDFVDSASTTDENYSDSLSKQTGRTKR